MSYATQYGNSRFDVGKKAKHKCYISICLCVSVIVIILQLIFPVQLSRFRKTVFPFLEPNVRQSLADMSESIRSGVPIDEAAAVFCREILLEADN